LDTPSYAYRN